MRTNPDFGLLTNFSVHKGQAIRSSLLLSDENQIIPFFSHFKNVRSLDFDYKSKAFGLDLILILENCKTFESISVHLNQCFFESIDMHLFLSNLQCQENLRDLTIEIEDIPAEHSLMKWLTSVLDACPHLETLKIDFSFLTIEKFFNKVEGENINQKTYSNITSITCCNIFMSTEDFAYFLGGFSKAQFVQLINCESIDTEVINALKKFHDLRHLEINTPDLPRAIIYSLPSHCEKLEIINLSKSSISDEDEIILDSSAFSHYLKVVKLTYCSLSKVWLSKLVSECPNLEYLQLESIDVLSAEDIKIIANCKELKILNLCDTFADPETIVFLLSHLDKLEELTIGNPDSTDLFEGTDIIMKKVHNNLTTLNMDAPKMSVEQHTTFIAQFPNLQNVTCLLETCELEKLKEKFPKIEFRNYLSY